jgi:hypothetical protein
MQTVHAQLVGLSCLSFNRLSMHNEWAHPYTMHGKHMAMPMRTKPTAPKAASLVSSCCS